VCLCNNLEKASVCEKSFLPYEKTQNGKKKFMVLSLFDFCFLKMNSLFLFMYCCIIIQDVLSVLRMTRWVSRVPSMVCRNDNVDFRYTYKPSLLVSLCTNVWCLLFDFFHFCSLRNNFLLTFCFYWMHNQKNVCFLSFFFFTTVKYND